MKRLIRRLLQRADYDVSRRAYPLSASQGEFRAARALVEGATMTTDPRKATLFDQARYCELSQVEGSIVECGVWRGGSIGLAALALKGINDTPKRHLHLFDSFDDICAPDPTVDGERALQEFPGAQQRSPGAVPTPVKGAYDLYGGHGTVDACRKLIESTIAYPAEYVHYHIGWFQKTVPEKAHEIGPIALLRLDGDWYESTKVCLDHLYDLVSPRGFVIVDDYGFYEGCRLAVDEFISNHKPRPFLHRVDSSCYYIQKA
jgi:O-methyltransferase